MVPEHKQSVDVFTISGWNDLYDDGWIGVFKIILRNRTIDPNVVSAIWIFHLREQQRDSSLEYDDAILYQMYHLHWVVFDKWQNHWGKYISIYSKLSNSIKTTFVVIQYSANTRKYDCSILSFRGGTGDCR